ncbi:DMT family transporter [Arvimicrobium flavum]|uniref:DMT family transporter n=1 Tax=Arvimicrobium flavum TaxID=3393320 RepID=UPI00237B5915|nr:DMT family transporter [Mesorhizobium shangrilense]
MTERVAAASNMPPVSAVGSERVGALLVFLSALLWSFGGAIARSIEVGDTWTVVFWRSVWAGVFIVGFMLWRDGVRGTAQLVRAMGLPGLAVACCLATASTSFVVALEYTTVANILLIQAGGPLFAALLAWVVFRERIRLSTWLAIAAVIIGVVIMVSDSFAGDVSPIGDGLALLIAVVFAVATVITRRFAHVRMTPAMCLAVVFSAVFAASRADGFAVSSRDMAYLFAFGAINLGLGLALFATGARLIPASFAALLGTFEPILGPIWVWLAHSEVPSSRTMIGGSVVFLALLIYLVLEFRRQSQPARPGAIGLSAPR